VIRGGAREAGLGLGKNHPAPGLAAVTLAGGAAGEQAGVARETASRWLHVALCFLAVGNHELRIGRPGTLRAGGTESGVGRRPAPRDSSQSWYS
jgi:hypothetical protein